MESMYKLLQVRRSHRKFTEQAVEQEKIDAILRNALMSPAGKSLNPWEFIVVTDKEMQEKMSKCKPFDGAFLAEAPLSIVIIADTEKSDVWVEDCSIVAFNIQLTAEDLGLGSCWAQVRNRQSCTEGVMAGTYVKELLQIPEQYEVECIISIGYKGMERKPFNEDKLQFDKIHNEQF
jgi:nitroreductase